MSATPRKQLLALSVLLVTVFSAFLVSAPITYAQGSGPDSEQRGVTPLVASSPFAAPESNDTTFVVDDGGGLDTGCTYRGEGPLVFDVLVDRVPGDVAKLKAKTLIAGEAILRMPAFDVDYGAVVTGINPERDKVYFNDHLVPSQFLTGENQVWKLNAFNIPIDWIKFPTDPGETGTVTAKSNTIRIDIDTANTDVEAWCTSIDWASLSIRIAKPVLAVHGIFSSGTAWEQTWKPELTSAGLPFATLNMGALDGIQDNAAKIDQKVASLRRRWGIDKLNIVAHSKGGLDSRHYIEGHDTVDRLIQLGTPNAGSPLADAVQAGVAGAIGIIPTALIDQLVGEASYQLTTPYMAGYNLFHGSNPNTTYVSLAGDYRFGGFFGGALDAGLRKFYGGPSDMVVPVWSVHALSYAKHIPFSTTGANREAMHTSLNESKGAFDRVYPFLSTVSSSSRSAAPLPASSTNSLISAVEVSPTLTIVGTIADSIDRAETQRHSLTIDQVAVGGFLLYTSADLSLTLISPSGTRVTPVDANKTPDIEYVSIDDTTGPRFRLYSVNNPEVGVWTLEVASPSTNPPGRQPYFLIGTVSGGDLQFEASADKDAYHTGDAIVIKATARSQGQPIAGTTMTAKVILPDQSSATINLLDNGQGDDSIAGDGQYSGRYTTTLPGTHSILVEANSTGPTRFSRDTLLVAPVSSSTSRLSGSFSDAGIDTDSDGLFNALVVDVGLNITASARYRLFGVLLDGSGTIIATSASTEQLIAGSRTIRLHFDGLRLFQHGADGPYKVGLLRLAEDDGLSVLPLDERTNAHTTKNYTYRQFQRPNIYVSGKGTDKATDSNGDGRFDLLTLTVDVDVLTAGMHNWSGKLVDRKGTELGFVAGSGNLQKGSNSISFVFDGAKIGLNGVDGPFYLTDLLIYSSADSAVILEGYTTAPYQVRTFKGFSPKVPASTVTISCAGTLSATLSLDIVDAAVKLDSVTVKLEGTTTAQITIVPNLAGQILSPGQHTLTATFTNVTLAPGVKEVQAVFTTSVEGITSTTTSPKFELCKYKVLLPMLQR